jgi:hypothetical protein
MRAFGFWLEEQQNSDPIHHFPRSKVLALKTKILLAETSKPKTYTKIQSSHIWLYMKPYLLFYK